MKLMIEPVEGQLSVQLIIDMSEYCALTKKALLIPSVPNPSLDKTKRSEEAEALFQARQHFILQLSEFSGASHWLQVKQLWSTQCQRSGSILEQQLAQALAREIAPHAIQSLNNGFVELIKNSMDALLRGYLADQRDETMLTLIMTIQLEFKAETLSVRVIDNAGGFPQAFLDSYHAVLGEEGLRRNTASTKEQQALNCFFGGAGIGLLELYRMILKGEVRSGGSGEGPFQKAYEVNPGTTSIRFLNHETSKGAEICLTSPLKPFEVVPKPTELLSSIGVAPGFFLKKPPTKRARIETAVPTAGIMNEHVNYTQNT